MNDQPSWGGEDRRSGKRGRLDHRSFVPIQLARRTPAKAGRRPYDIRRYWLERLVTYVTVMSVATVLTFAIIRPVQQRTAADKLRSACGLLQPVKLLRGLPLCTHGGDPVPPPTTPQVQAASGQVACYGDGQNGQRVEVLYAHTVSVASRLNQFASQFASTLASTDGTFNSAANGSRHVRFVTDQSCHVPIIDFTLASDGADTFGNTIRDLSAAGYARSDRHYLVFVDASVYCGIASLANDDRLISTNANNANVEYARLDNGCWTSFVAAHELSHTFGGVQLSAPHSSGAYHCYDANSVECYNDGGSYFANGGKMQTFCSSGTPLDCNNDDFFNASPPAGSYLAGHWNDAMSGFLDLGSGSTTFPGPPNQSPSLPGPTPSTTIRPTTVPPPVTTRPPTTIRPTTTTIHKKHCTLFVFCS